MIQELTNPFGRVYLSIETDSLNKLIYVKWMGYLTEDNIKTGGKTYLDTMVAAGYNCVLNDTRLIIGSWDHSMEWVLNEWAPMAARNGLKRFVMLANPDTFGGSSAATFLNNLRSFEARDFDNIAEARKWLKAYYTEKLPH